VSTRRVLLLGLVLVAALASAPGAHADEAKVLRLALPDIANLDPQQLTDLNSERVANAIFEGLYQFDYLAAPARVVPNTAAAMPEIADNGRTWTIRIKSGILFANAPVFNGKPRELTAQDYVYSITRRLDPNLKRGGDAVLTDLLEGARPVIDAARKSGKLDYDAKIEGLAAIDRHTLRLKLTAADYTVLERLADIGTFAVAREAVEAAGADVVTKPVGTGPFRLGEWVRGSRVRARGEFGLPRDFVSRQQRSGAAAHDPGDEGAQAAGIVANRDFDHGGADVGAPGVRPGATSTTSD
jgi:ABC-type transport system substrate-binding protein